jgi:hypothetical protein
MKYSITNKFQYRLKEIFENPRSLDAFMDEAKQDIQQGISTPEKLKLKSFALPRL